MAHLILIQLVVLFFITISSTKVNVKTIQQGPPNPYAKIFLYSGRPNPRWRLTFQEWVQLNQLIQTLPKISGGNIGPYKFHGKLGYSGFYAHFIAAASYPDIYYVANKRQTILSNPGTHVVFNDKQKLVEKWFIDSARSHGIPIPTLV